MNKFLLVHQSAPRKHRLLILREQSEFQSRFYYLKLKQLFQLAIVSPSFKHHLDFKMSDAGAGVAVAAGLQDGMIEERRGRQVFRSYFKL